MSISFWWLSDILCPQPIPKICHITLAQVLHRRGRPCSPCRIHAEWPANPIELNIVICFWQSTAECRVKTYQAREGKRNGFLHSFHLLSGFLFTHHFKERFCAYLAQKPRYCCPAIYDVEKEL